MITVHDLVLNMLTINPDFDFGSIRGLGFNVDYPTKEINPRTGKTVWATLPKDYNALQAINHLYNSHVQALEYFIKGKSESDKVQAKQRLATLHNDYAPFLKVKPYGVIGEDSASVQPANVEQAIATLTAALLAGKMTPSDFAASVQALNSTSASVEPTTPKTTNKRIINISASGVKTGTTLPSNGSETLPKIAARKGKNDHFYVLTSDLKAAKIDSYSYDDTFTATLVHGNAQTKENGKWIVTSVRKTEVTVKRYIP